MKRQNWLSDAAFVWSRDVGQCAEGPFLVAENWGFLLSFEGWEAGRSAADWIGAIPVEKGTLVT